MVESEPCANSRCDAVERKILHDRRVTYPPSRADVTHFVVFLKLQSVARSLDPTPQHDAPCEKFESWLKMFDDMMVAFPPSVMITPNCSFLNIEHESMVTVVPRPSQHTP